MIAGYPKEIFGECGNTVTNNSALYSHSGPFNKLIESKDGHAFDAHEIFCTIGQSGAPLIRMVDENDWEVVGVHMGRSQLSEDDDVDFFTSAIITTPVHRFIKKSIKDFQAEFG